MRVSTLTMVTLLTARGAGLTAITWSGRYPDQVLPRVPKPPLPGAGEPSGLPQPQRTRGTPRSSIRTAVPACSTAW